jgi:hypothetical protein
MNSIPRRIPALLITALILVFAVAATGCGGDDKDSSGGGDSSSQKDSVDNTPDNVDEAVDKCLQEADKLNGDAKKTATAACKAAKTGDTSDVQKAAVKQCLNLAEQIPVESEKEKAKRDCRDSVR